MQQLKIFNNGKNKKSLMFICDVPDYIKTF